MATVTNKLSEQQRANLRQRAKGLEEEVGRLKKAIVRSLA